MYQTAWPAEMCIPTVLHCGTRAHPSPGRNPVHLARVVFPFTDTHSGPGAVALAVGAVLPLSCSEGLWQGASVAPWDLQAVASGCGLSWAVLAGPVRPGLVLGLPSCSVRRCWETTLHLLWSHFQGEALERLECHDVS